MNEHMGRQAERARAEANEQVKRHVTVEVQDVRGKTVELTFDGEAVKIQTKAMRVSPIPVENLRSGLRKLGISES